MITTKKKVCCGCHKKKLMKDFGKNRTRKDGHQGLCKKCRSEYDRKRYYHPDGLERDRLKKKKNKVRIRNRKFVSRYLSSHSCVDCGEYNIVNLNLYYKKTGKKCNMSSCIFGGSIEIIKSKMDECDVKCKSCHKAWKRQNDSKKHNRKKRVLLGMSFGMASGKLKKMLLFSFMKKLDMDLCYRCGKNITKLEEFSVDHKKSWMYAENPVDAFFDIENNIAFSHIGCNVAAAYKPNKIYKNNKEYKRESFKRYYAKEENRKRRLESKRKRYHRNKKLKAEN